MFFPTLILGNDFLAGLPRTGTLSTFTALEMLLPGNCHHMARSQQKDLEAQATSNDTVLTVLKYDRSGWSETRRPATATSGQKRSVGRRPGRSGDIL